MALVIKEWQVNEEAEEHEAIVAISGRQEGLLSWLLSLIKIDPTTILKIYHDKIEISQGSFSGNKKISIPANQVSSAYFGYTKPWKIALIITLALLPVVGIGLILGPLYYLFNKQLELAVIATSGHLYSINFKRSVIEGQNIGEEDGHSILDIIEKIILKKNE
jgi:hypothetical protein